MEKSLILRFFGESPVFKIIDFLIDNKGLDLSKKDIIEGSGISRAVFFKYWPQIESQELVLVTRKFGKTKLYILNSKNPLIKKLLEFEFLLIGKTLDKRKMIELQSI